VLGEVRADDPDEGLKIVASAVARGQGKTQGYHERRVPTTRKVKRLLSLGDTDKVAAAGQQRADEIAKLTGQVLRPALYCLLRDGKEAEPLSRAQQRTLERKADGWVKRLEQTADADFFERLWDEFETDDADERNRVHGEWLRRLISRAEAILREACEAVPLASIHRYRARARALGLFGYLARRKSFPHLFEEQEHGPAESAAA
jgi:CRISPR system Cascade subunit CasA